MATSVVGVPAVWDDTAATRVVSPPSSTVDVSGPAYDADATGATSSTTAIQAAIDALGTAGGTVTGKLGTYLLTHAGSASGLSNVKYAVRVPYNAGPITFDFPRGTVFKLADSQTSQTACLVIDGESANRRTNPTIVRGITFDGNYANQTGWVDFGPLTALYANDVTIEHCTVQNYPTFGFHILRDCRGVKLLDCVFDGTHALAEGTGASLRIEVQDILIQGCRFVCDALAGRTHITLGDNADIQLQGAGMRIIGNCFAGGYAGAMVALDGVAYCTVRDNVFRDVCDLTGWALRVSLYINAGNASANVNTGQFNVIDGNVFFNCRQCIDLTGNATSMTVNATTQNYTTGALANIVAHNVLTSDPIAVKTIIGSADTYPDRFSPAPNAAAVNMTIGIRVVGADKDGGLRTATSATATTISDSTASFATAGPGLINWLVVVVGGTGKGQVRRITANTGTQLTVATWDVTPDTTSTFRVVSNVGFNLIQGNIVHASNNSTKCFDDDSFLPNLWLDNMGFNSNTGSVAFTNNNPLAITRGNKCWANSIMGDSPAAQAVYQDESAGVATIASGTTSIVVTHKLGRTPTAEQVMVWPTTNWGSMTEYWVDTITSTQFTINADANPAEDVSFGWRAFGAA